MFYEGILLICVFIRLIVIFYIKSPNEIKNIEIFDVAGRKVMNTNVSSKQKETQVNLEKLNSGVYILKTYTSSGLETFKVIKKD